MTHNQLLRARRGISLLEILFSIGVVIIGLLGVISLIPVAADQVRRGNLADAAATVGHNAARTFVTRGMAGPLNWRSPVWYSVSPSFNAAQIESELVQKRSFCIDPRFVAVNGATLPAGMTNPPYDPTLFPYYVITDANLECRMWRVSLSTHPFRGVSFPTPTPNPMMSRFQADAMFMDRSKILFNRPSDRTLLSTPVYSFHPGPDGGWGVAGVDDNGNSVVDDPAEAGAPGSDDVPAIRESTGEVSWMATLVPQVHFADTTYILTTVVFNQRGDMTIDGTQESLVDVDWFLGAGINGGDVRLRTRSGRPKSDLEDLKQGTHIMLSGKLVTQNFGAAALMDRFDWYKVVAVESEIEFDSSNSTFTRFVTLAGRDWSRVEWTVPTTNPLFRPTQGTILRSAIGVFERTVKLESSSLWN